MKKLRICTVLLLLMLLCGCTAKSPAFPDSRASEEIFSSAGSEESTVDERKAETAAEGSTANTTEQAASESVSSDSTPVSSDNEKQTERRTPPAETKAEPETPKATQPYRKRRTESTDNAACDGGTCPLCDRTSRSTAATAHRAAQAGSHRAGI